MKVFFRDGQKNHNPKNFLVMGNLQPNPETPERADALLSAAIDGGLELEAPDLCGLGPVAAIHSPAYLEFLRTIHREWSNIPGAGPEVIPNIHPNRLSPDAVITSPAGKAGLYMADTACPISGDTWASALESASCAVAAAETVLGGAGEAYALCRPPGHHAFADMAGGFCFLNNSAIAAQILRRQHDRVAILDVDVHHGNGTQGVFYRRPDVLTLSIHRDPVAYYPFYWGHAHEFGEGDGQGCNLNLPLPKGAGDDAFLDALQTALQRITAFAPGALVVALGLDAHESDPLRGLQVTTDGFARIAEAIGRLSLPTVLVQEGGYLNDALGPNLASALKGFMAARS